MNSHQSTLSFQKLTCFYIQSPETTHHIIAYGLKNTLKNNKAGFFFSVWESKEGKQLDCP